MEQLDCLAHDIHEDYKDFTKGMRAYLRMGIRLHMVKESLPHGDFMKWCVANLRVQRSHIGDSMRLAVAICEICKIQITSALVICENSKSALNEMIDGKSQRQVLAIIQEYRNDPTEEAAKLWCEDRWERNPKERDDWELRVASGEITYIYAKIGMIGADNTKEQPRGKISYSKLLLRNAGSYTAIWKQWANLDEKTRHEGLAKLQEAFAEAPEEVKKCLTAILR